MSKNVEKLSSLPAEKGSFSLPEKDEALFSEMLEKWATRRIGTLRQQKRSVENDIAVVRDMLAHAGNAPWFWTEDDFDAWCETIGVERSLAVATQRKYQSAIRNFFDYIVDNVKFKNEVRRQYGLDLQQICHSENCIPHVHEREMATERRAFTHDEIARLFDGYDKAINEAAVFRSKDLRPLQRDKALFFLLYSAGLRISEALALNMTSFSPNPNIPEFGKFGFVSVWGKGSKGSGKKFRTVPVTHSNLPPILDWYIANVRPHFMINADANESALFLSERGRRMGASTLEARFQHGLEFAGLAGLGLTPHCMRHSSVTHESYRFGIEANRRKHGHAYASTTQIYMHVPDEMVNDEINQAIASQLDQALGKEEKK
ncbi:MAG: tyrosine-type recombinase/integrase [Betaproteobacteria bacterium]|nr:tyrosine-type recombinase/integrase [Betaproteobacteria bacterium]